MSLALYRRYRPETFAEVIGQEHVTGPLAQALSSGRIHHAFLFSGPRGCGKTSSARILARALNCEQGPTPTPCGTCQSCTDLATGGPGSLDVIEIDAASHGGVDDARDLRERAFYAPVQSRYKVYIVDEAHMVSREGFNALLKLVEEPPEHLKFVFATTEPDKVLTTIRSRTHHYAFRLVAPRVLADHLRGICESEGVSIDDEVLPLVVRAGAGSVRDALSVLDQLVSGAPDRSVTVGYAAGLLGYTDGALLDAVVDAFGLRSGGAVFETLDRALDSGLDPRRFVADLLERFRDLLIIAVSGAEDLQLEALVPGSPDARERMREQAQLFGPAELTRNAELLAQGLIEMRGATAPRLTLEIIAARMLLPSADDTERNLQVRLEQLERQVRQGGGSGTPAQPLAASSTSLAPPVSPAPAAPAPTAPAVTSAPAPAPARAATSASSDGHRAADTAPRDAAEANPRDVSTSAPESAVGASQPGPASSAQAESAGSVSVDDMRRMWPRVIDNVKGRKRSAWIQLNRPGAGVLSVDAGRLALGLPDAGTVKGFINGGYGDIVRLAVMDELGVDLEVDVIAQSAAGSAPATASAPQPAPARASSSTSSPTSAGSAKAKIQAAQEEAAAQPVSLDADIVHESLDAESTDDALSAEALLAQAFDTTEIGDSTH